MVGGNVKHCLLNGREVFLVRFGIVETYAGVLEGTAEAASTHIVETAPRRAAAILPPARPLIVVPPGAGALPPWLCVAEFASQQGVSHDDPDYSSRLYACWFARDTTQSIDVMAASILPSLNWEEAAEDFDIVDF